MKNKSANQRRKTAQFQLTSRFSLILFGLLILFNLLFILLSVGYLFEHIENRASNILEAIEKGEASGDAWDFLVNAYVSADEEDALQVILADGSVVSSEDAEEIFADINQGRVIPFLEDIVFTEEGIYYTKTQEVDGDQVTIAINGEDSVELAYGLFMISSFLNLIAVVVGSLLIYWSVGKWSQKLTGMAQEIAAIEQSRTGELTVSEEPIEIRSVALAFNKLLKEQRETIEREKRFVADASHELRTPLAAIRGHVQLIQRRGTKHPEVIPSSMAFIDKESKRLETLSNQLLDLEKNQSQDEMTLVDVSQIVREECEKQATIVPQSIEYFVENQCMKRAHKRDFQQIIQNLLENAAKYSPADQPIHVTLTQEQRQMSLTVADFGIGIPDDKKALIFERFYRVEDSRSSQIAGSGIGLSLVKQLADKYHAKITVTDNQPQGSIFKLAFPNERER
ncbi:HAMP domain-containing histidine kinase [Enterococcus casseliflavus]|uniref:sensor histidine kinase n=1 Tax=Enterococcus casseliflavus TaxID=37734 RepID=UPI0019189BAC|nr:HAMP domain-containing sensor histidine kinase [Enterococcus casseliflavus]QQU19595.1 HAMP domain-containing histidine kinase [Enterococcus casseliflavus]